MTKRIARLHAFLDTFSDHFIREVAEQVVYTGDTIKRLAPAFEQKTGEGHRSGITAGDLRSQEMLLSHLSKYPDIKILSEEGTRGVSQFLAPLNPIGILNMPQVVILDPIDGTTMYAHQKGTWCIGLGTMTQGVLTGSILYAPALNGGLLLVADRNGSACISEWNFSMSSPIPPPVRTSACDCLIAMGNNLTLYPAFTHLVPSLSQQIRLWTIANSGLLGLMEVACGRVQASIQTPEKSWDWAPAYRAVISTGRVFQFFRLILDEERADGTCRLIPVQSYDDDAFNAFPIENRLGYVAGEPDVVEWIFSQLPQQGWGRFNPDTVGS